MSNIRNYINIVEILNEKKNIQIDDKFKKWFGNSKIVDSSGNPLIVYHGTFNNFEAFDTTNDMIFFSTVIDFANGYATSEIRSNGRVLPCYLRVQKLFDFREQSSQKIASNFYSLHGEEFDLVDNHKIRISIYGNENIEDDDNVDIHEGPLEHHEWMAAIREGQYPALEQALFVDYIRSLGYDGMVIVEHEALNYAVFSPNQAKSAVSNTGNYDRNNKKITENKKSQRN